MTRPNPGGYAVAVGLVIACAIGVVAMGIYVWTQAGGQW